MKRILFLYVIVLFLSIEGIAQKKVAKVSVAHLFFKNISVGYEYKLTDIVTLNIVAGGYVPHKTTFILDQIAHYMGAESVQGNTFGGSIAPEIRVYTWRKAPKGFYFNLVTRCEAHFFNLEAEIYDKQYLHNFIYQSPIFYYKANATLGFGYQWVINRKYVIDWTIIGLGYGIHHYAGYVDTDNPKFNTEEGLLECQEDLTNSKMIYKNARLEKEGSNVKFKNMNVLPAIHSGFSIGILIKEKK